MTTVTPDRAVLDNPIWHSLTGAHAHLAQLHGRAGTYPDEVAQFYGIANTAEAAAYWAHPLLGARLRECVAAMLRVPGKSAVDVLGEVDALKFRSCLTLFLQVAPADPGLVAALERFYGGEPDPLTLGVVRAERG